MGVAIASNCSRLHCRSADNSVWNCRVIKKHIIEHIKFLLSSITRAERRKLWQKLWAHAIVGANGPDLWCETIGDASSVFGHVEQELSAC